MASKVKGRVNRCSRCGQLKRGHKCTAPDAPLNSATKGQGKSAKKVDPRPKKGGTVVELKNPTDGMEYSEDSLGDSSDGSSSSGEREILRRRKKAKQSIAAVGTGAAAAAAAATAAALEAGADHQITAIPPSTERQLPEAPYSDQPPDSSPPQGKVGDSTLGDWSDADPGMMEHSFGPIADNSQ